MQFDGWYIQSKPKFSYIDELETFVLTESGDGDAWIFLFIDLVYVAIFAKLSRALDNCDLSLHTIDVVEEVVAELKRA